ncbi:MAG: sugar ABC transporter ATP-binding protein [Bacillota bacterium]|nr:sugar ABC transporter ATP-binding protein [Bacillota bacterium]
MQNSIIEMRSISKAFPGVQALQDCSLEIKPGEVHALLGENGAGKSTLMKILTGIYQADSGEILFEGQKVKIGSVLDARALGITMIHQELNLLSNLTIAQNIFIGKEIRKNGIFLDEKAIRIKSAELLERVNLNVDPNTMVSELTVAQQQMVEIAKAVSYNSRAIIMDEPTAPLSSSEIERLFDIIRDMKKSGISVIYISHRMDEIKRICDRATILRDGQYIATVDVAETSLDDIIAAMVGRKVTFVRKKRDKSKILAEEVLRVEDLNWGSKVKNVSFSLHKGEVLGFAGLVGAGRTETARLVFGAEKPDRGSIYVKGKKVIIKTPYDAVNCGISYLSEDRKQFGLITEMSVENNITIASIPKLCKGLGYIDHGKCASEAEKYAEKLKIKTPSLRTLVKSLSGGNQQKIVVAKWLLRDTDVLIFDEPTRGIDIGAKDEICDLLVSLADMGKAVIMISSEMQEILRVCDRIIVMHEGEITGELDADTATQEDIMRLASKI